MRTAFLLAIVAGVECAASVILCGHGSRTVDAVQLPTECLVVAEIATQVESITRKQDEVEVSEPIPAR
jgi:hypothetical protein